MYDNLNPAEESKGSRASLLPVLMMLLLSSTAAYAQNLPSSVDPGQVNNRLERKHNLGHNPQVVVEPETESAAPAKESAEKIFSLKQVIVENSTVYGESGLRSTYAAYIGKEVSFSDLQAVARAMTAQYRKDGYILSRVVLKPQKIADGIVHFQALEGYVDRIDINGDIPGDGILIRKMADRIKAERPLNSKTLERYLLLIDDLPGITARGVLHASATQKGASDLNIHIENKSLEGSVSADNRGNKFLGPYQLTGVAAYNSALGLFDRTTGRVISDARFDELLFGDVTHEEQVGSDGDRVTIHAAASRVEPAGRLESLDIRGDTKLIELGYSHNYIRSRDINLGIRSDFRVQKTTNDILGTEQFDDNIRHLNFGVDFDASDSWKGINQLGVDLTQGLDILGASADGAGRSRINAKNDFSKFNLKTSRIQNITDDASAVLNVSGQYSFDSLLSSEQFGFGGDTFGRAYDSSEILGDSGLASSFELRYNMTPSDTSIVNAYQLYTFYDIGAVWLKDPLVGEQNRESATSTGVGVRFNFAYDTSGYLEWSLPLTRDVASEKDSDSRVFFSLVKRF